jgi:hypothetical protein
MDEPTMTNYISQLTLSEVWDEIKNHVSGIFWYILRIAVIVLIFYLLRDSFFSVGLSTADSFLKAIPWWIYVSIAFGFILWFGKGKRIAPRLPMIDFKLWLFLTVANSASLAALALLPAWFSFPLFALVNPVFYMERLIRIAQNKGYGYIE